MESSDLAKQNALILNNSFGREYVEEPEYIKNPQLYSHLYKALHSRIESVVTKGRTFEPLGRTQPSGLGHHKIIYNHLRQKLGFENIFDVYSTLAQMEVRDKKASTDPSEIGQKQLMGYLSRFLIDEQSFLKKEENFKGLLSVANKRDLIYYLGYDDRKKEIRLEGLRKNEVELRL